MKTFDVTVSWSGYSRGFSIYEVKAENEAEAKESWQESGDEVYRETVRDDTEVDNSETTVEESLATQDMRLNDD